MVSEAQCPIRRPSRAVCCTGFDDVVIWALDAE
jgi:hypothetical protein